MKTKVSREGVRVTREENGESLREWSGFGQKEGIIFSQTGGKAE